MRYVCGVFESRMTDGALIVAVGANAKVQADLCAKGLSIPFAIVDGLHGPGEPGRWAKVNLDQATKFERSLYLDADTRVQAPVAPGFDVLGDGWDLVIVPSTRQGEEALWHLEEKERELTILELGYVPLQLQGGVFWFARNKRVRAFFRMWRKEWRRFTGQDQGALLRALDQRPLKVWLFGFPWNSSQGALIQHRFGSAR